MIRRNLLKPQAPFIPQNLYDRVKAIGLTLVVFVLVFAGNGAWGQTRTASVSGNWNNTTTWGGQSVPTAVNDVVINDGINVTINIANAECQSLTINGGGSNTYVTVGANSLTVGGAITINAATSKNVNKYITVSSGTLNCASITMAATSTNTRDCYISITGTGSVNVSGDITMNATQGQRNYILFTGNGTLNVGGTITGGTITSTAGGGGTPARGTVNYNGAGNQAMGNYTYYNLTVSNGGTKSLQGNTTVTNSLTLNSGVLDIGNYNLTLNAASIVDGIPFSNTNMIVTSGTGFVIRNANLGLPVIYPIGSDGYYDPVTVDARNPITGTISMRTAQSGALGPKYVQRVWDIQTSVNRATLTLTFNYESTEASEAPTFIKYRQGAGAWGDPTGTSSFGSNSFTTTGNTSITTAGTHSFTAGTVGTYYSYQTGNWNVADTWTRDPGGTHLVDPAVPGNGDVVVILDGRTVTLTADVATTGLDITINPMGIIDMGGYRFTQTIQSFRGLGTLRLSSTNFPTVTSNLFVAAGGGTTEYYNSSDFNLPIAQTTYNNLSINVPGGITATQMNNLTLNGDLTVKTGTFRINDNTSARRQLTVHGDVTVNSGASLTVGTGVTNSTTDPYGIGGGTPPFLNYYDQHSHRVVLYGDLTNNGTVKFTNLDYPVYNAFPSTSLGATTGFATVYFMGATHNTVTCNGTTDFYNLVVDKGIDQSYQLTVYSTNYHYFRLFGANTAGGFNAGANPNLRKALWIRNGSLVLQGLTIIPSLSEGTCGDGATPNSNFYIPANGALVLDGPEVVVLSTADNYQEVNLAYGVAALNDAAMGITQGGCSSFSILGRLQVNDGYFSTRESGGFITWDWASGQFIINGGTVDAKQYRAAAAGGSGGLASYTQTGGHLLLRGRFQRTPTAYGSIEDLKDFSISTLNTIRATEGSLGDAVGSFNLNDASNVFTMSGGTITIYDVTGTGGAQQKAFEVVSSAGNINVSGGTLEIVPTTGTVLADPAYYYIESTAPVGNLTVNRVSGSSEVRLRTNPLTVLSHFTISAGDFNANNLDVTIGGNFFIAATTSYTSGNNRTIFNGGGTQTITNNTGLILNFHKFIVNKPDMAQLRYNSLPAININDSLRILSGTFLNYVRSVNCYGHVENNGINLNTSGYLVMNGDAAQTISGKGVFTNLRLNKPAAGTADVTLKNDITVNGILNFAGHATGYKRLNLDEYNLLLGPNASVTGYSDNRFIYTLGQVGNGGVSKVYSVTSNSFTFPIGAPSTRHAAPHYTPATISLSADPSAYGTVTVVPVGAVHFATDPQNRSLTYYWRVKTEGFDGIAPGSVSHSYTYSQDDVVAGGDVSEAGYVPARFDNSALTWSRGTTASIDPATNVMDGPWLSGVDYIDGDFTAGDDDPTNPFGAPQTFYSRQSGRWGLTSSWSTTGHGGAPASRVPGVADIVIIGNDHAITLNTHLTDPNTDTRSCANLRIEAGASLDIGYNPGCNFAVVSSHPNGNGLFRVACNRGPYLSSAVETFEFPSGDFTDFNKNLGTTDLYTTNDLPGTTFYLPNGTTSYGNLTISPLGGSNIIFANHDVLIYGTLTIKGQNADSWFLPTWNGNYPGGIPRIAKTITILGNMDIQGGSFGWYGGYGGGAQNLVVYGDIIVGQYSGINVWESNSSQSVAIGGSLMNYGNNQRNGVDCRSYVNFNAVPVTFFGDGDAVVYTENDTDFTGGQGSSLYDQNNPPAPQRYSATILGRVTVNKGNSQATTLTFTGGMVSTPDNNWLTLQNGTLSYQLSNPRRDFTVSTTTALTIPGTAGLEVNLQGNSNGVSTLIANANSHVNDLFLHGKLTVANATVYVGPTSGTANYNNDIEYGGGGLSEIDVQDGGTLVVNGQIRMSPSSTAGVLKYRQSGNSRVVINGQAANLTKAKLEVYNPGSVFEMTGSSSLYILRGGGGSTYGDLYIRPETSNVSGSSTIEFTKTSPMGASANVTPAQSYVLDATVSLNNLTITGFTTGTVANRYATVTLLISPLQLNGDLTISNAYSTFDANSAYNVNVSLKGDFVNNGTYNYYNNLTTFNGNTQRLEGTAVTNFYNLTVNPITSLTLIRNITVDNDLTLSSGQLLNGTYTINLKRHLVNNANYDGDVATGGVVLNGTVLQEISGTGTFGRLELDNSLGARINNSITLQRNIRLTNGIFSLNKYLMTMGVNSNIEGSSFGASKMFTTDGVFSNVGIRKHFAVYSGAAQTFTYPMGTSGKYTPAVLTYTNIGNVGYVRINNINSHHPSAYDPANVLDYYWELESYGISGFDGNVVFNYKDADVRVTGGNTEADYIAAAVMIPGNSWAKYGTGDVDEDNNTIIFRYSGSNNLSGEYTAGIDVALPDNVPEFTNIATGSWNDISNWEQTGGDPYTLTGPPNGFIVTIRNGTTVTVSENYARTYRTRIDGTLHFDPDYYGHSLGTVTGSGTLHLESGTFPAGRYSQFFDCSNNSVLEYGGNTDYTIIADLYSSLPNLYFVGTGTRNVPNKDLTICRRLLIDGPTLNNASNRKLTIQGTFERLSGSFISGSGANAVVSFAGSAPQTIGGALGNFTGANAFNYFEINNPAGLTVNGSGAIEVKGNLLLTSGNITTSSNATLTITNTAINCVTPAQGKATSFVDGPLTKRINHGDKFIFPIGKGSTLGHKLEITATQTSGAAALWTAEYFTPNPTFTDFTDPLTYVNAQEYWSVSAPVSSQAYVHLTWDPSSDLTPLMTENGVSDMRVAGWNTGTSSWEEISSSASGDGSNGTVRTFSRVAIPAAGFGNFTTACINITKPRARFSPSGPICGDVGIPLTFSGVDGTNLNFVLTYRKGGVLQPAVTVNSLPYTLPTDATGNTYQLVSFTYNNPPHAAPVLTGVVDATIVTAYTVPTPANAGSDQSLCGATSATLDGNNPIVGTGLWSIFSGDGGTVIQPTVNNSEFNGVNGNTYILTWTISNGGCTSSDNVTISFPLMPVQPDHFVLYTDEVCQGDTEVRYSVVNDPSLTYTWGYDGEHVNISGTGNVVEVDFLGNATSGTISVFTTNDCGDSDPLELYVTVFERPTATLSVISPHDAICDGDNTEITVTLTGGTSPYSFEIFNGTDTETINGATSPYTFIPDAAYIPTWLGPGTNNTYTYSIPVVTSANGCSNSGDNTVDVVVYKIPETGPQYHIPNTHDM
ncbi:MAG: hypothetical protein BWX49_00057 [Bacteroidetes bacterium ADurb.Bin008]|nr:MAG: hypothetical protein BWX49_00057 [Bacteroidetes bacterium ADurb.Bin008]